ncbi:MAG: hypothetical protein GY874_14200 [Desulfobacteraceae bacterium]|nr:hypothetical protein [Desulfobacteraceae bacterium]
MHPKNGDELSWPFFFLFWTTSDLKCGKISWQSTGLDVLKLGLCLYVFFMTKPTQDRCKEAKTMFRQAIFVEGYTCYMKDGNNGNKLGGLARKTNTEAP